MKQILATTTADTYRVTFLQDLSPRLRRYYVQVENLRDSTDTALTPFTDQDLALGTYTNLCARYLRQHRDF